MHVCMCYFFLPFFNYRKPIDQPSGHLGTGDQPAEVKSDIFIQRKLLGGAVQCFGDMFFAANVEGVFAGPRTFVSG